FRLLQLVPWSADADVHRDLVYEYLAHIHLFHPALISLPLKESSMTKRYFATVMNSWPSTCTRASLGLPPFLSIMSLSFTMLPACFPSTTRQRLPFSLFRWVFSFVSGSDTMTVSPTWTWLSPSMFLPSWKERLCFPPETVCLPTTFRNFWDASEFASFTGIRRPLSSTMMR